MAHLRQDQRRTMETLFEGRPALPSALHTYNEFYLGEGRVPLHFLGISEGFGTCSRIHGVDVAVFGLKPFEQQTALRNFAHAFLLRPALPEEMTEYQRLHDMAVGVVERLLFCSMNCTKAYFKLSGFKATYVIRGM